MADELYWIKGVVVTKGFSPVMPPSGLQPMQAVSKINSTLPRDAQYRKWVLVSCAPHQVHVDYRCLGATSKECDTLKQ